MISKGCFTGFKSESALEICLAKWLTPVIILKKIAIVEKFFVSHFINASHMVIS